MINITDGTTRLQVETKHFKLLQAYAEDFPGEDFPLSSTWAISDLNAICKECYETVNELVRTIKLADFLQNDVAFEKITAKLIAKLKTMSPTDIAREVGVTPDEISDLKKKYEWFTSI